MSKLVTLLVGSAFLFALTDRAAGQTYNYYFGGIHAHTEYSDGNKANDPAYMTAKSCFEYGKAAQHLDFLGISEHNHSQAGMSLPDFHKGLIEADSVNQDGVFTTMLGMEYGVISSGGHVLIYGIDSLIGWEAGNYDIYNAKNDYNGLFTKVVNHPGSFAYLAHMQSTDYDSLLSRPYNAVWDSAIVGLAMRNGPATSTDTNYSSPSGSTYNARYKDLLKKGYHVGVGMDQDNHYITFGRVNASRTVVMATSLTRANIMDAYRHRRFYASDDWNAKVNFTINGSVMGSIVSMTSNPSINLTMSDGDNETASAIKIWYGVPGSNIAPIELTSITGSNNINYTHTIAVNSSYYYYAEITQADGDKIWTTPIWFTKINEATLNLKLFLQGTYIGSGLMRPTLNTLFLNPDTTAADTIQVNLWMPNHLSNSSADYSLKTILHNNGNATLNLPGAVAGGSFYIQINHRSSVQTWSAFPITFSASTNYDFTTSSSQAYGNNLIMVNNSPELWAIYCGDINRDMNVDLMDYPDMDYYINNGFFGYFNTDLNGDGNIDLLDFPVLDGNIVSGIFSIIP